jgi:hypothetical protein
MALVFKQQTIKIPNAEKEQESPPVTVTGFTPSIKNAAVTLQGFRFDFEGVQPHPVDHLKVQVAFDQNPVGTTTAVVKATVDYSGVPPSQDALEYNAEVYALVIAEV